MKITFFLLLFITLLHSSEVVDKKGSCQINWTKGYVICKGESAAGQNRYAANLSAKVVAQRNLLEVIKGIHIDSSTTVQDGIDSNEIIKSRVSGMIRGTQMISTIYDEKEKYSISTVKLRMGKDLLSALLSNPQELTLGEKINTIWKKINIITAANASIYSISEKKTIEKLLKDLRDNQNVNASKYVENILNDMECNIYSGVLVDISSIENFKKAMIVKLVDENGKEIYPSNLVSRKTLLRKNTSVGYIYGYDDARKNKRVCSKPLELKVDKVYKHKYSNIVLSKEQIEQLNLIDKSILINAKVILVLGD